MISARTNFDRAQLLLAQRRYADAERELRQALAQDPHFALAHALLAEALLEQRRADEATNEAGLAITLEPDLEVAHYIMGRVLLERNRPDEAEQAVQRALQLARYPRTFGLLAIIRFNRRDWSGALAASDAGLAIDPENSGCLNLRAMALRQLGLKDAADATLRGALENDPEDSFAHANRGWSELHHGRPREALVHFQEALRLDPSNDHARAGLVEAMKARYLIYRLLLGYFFFMGRLARTSQAAIVIGGWIGFQVLNAFGRANPGLAWVTTPLIVAYVAFALMTWLAAPLMNLLLRLHPVGRHALSTEQRRTTNVVGGLLLAAAVAFAVSVATGRDGLQLLALYLTIAALPGSLIFRGDRGWPRWVLAGMTAAVVAIAVVISLAVSKVIPPVNALHACGYFVNVKVSIVKGRCSSVGLPAGPIGM
jgi:tetratricopeptide (TPR) repeat protein